MLKSRIYVLVSIFSRLVSGFLVFIVLARYLRPADFGLFGTSFAYGLVASVLTDFGLSTYGFREASKHHDRAGSIIFQCILLKLMLSTLVIVPLGLWIAIAGLDLHDAFIASLVIFGVLIASFGDLAYIIFKAIERNELETGPVVLSSIVGFLMVGATVFLFNNLLYASVAFFASRCLYAAVAFFASRKFINFHGLGAIFHNGISLAKLSYKYALDGLLFNLLGQIDILVVGILMSRHDSGIYQAGGRLLQLTSPFSMALSTIYLPRLMTAMENNKSAYLVLKNKLTVEYAVVGGFCSAAFYYLGPIVTEHIYGVNYMSLMDLWLGFAILVFFRMILASLGTQLIVFGDTNGRVFSQIVGIIVFVSISTYFSLIGYGDLKYIPWLLCGANLVIIALYLRILVRRRF